VHPDLIAPALMLTRKGGTAVLTGIVPYDESVVPVMLSDMILSHKRLQGALYGGMNPQASTPMLLSMYQQGRLKLDELVTRRYGLDQLNEAIDDMREGRIIRGVSPELTSRRICECRGSSIMLSTCPATARS